MRSSWSRRTLSASAHWIASSIRGEDGDAELVRRCAAAACAGPHTPTSAPSLVSPQMLLRATRLCRMSPQMATLSPSIRLNRSRSVSMSSSPCVGCSCLPSPALITLDSDPLAEELRRARRAVADHHHVDPHRLEVPRGVHQRLALGDATSPAAATFTVSALSRFSANSNEIRVRVEASKKRLTMVLPRSAGTFLIAPLAHFLERLGGVEDEADLLARSAARGRPGPCRG